MSALASLSIRNRVLALVAVTALGLAAITAMAAVQGSDMQRNSGWR